MPEPDDPDLVRRTQALLDPGDIELNGVIVQTSIEGSDDLAMHDATIQVGEIIASIAGAGDDWYVYSGSDDPDFSSNQHQGLTIADDEFIWECQQLLPDGTFDLVFYYEASLDQEAILTTLEENGFSVTGVRGG